MATSNQRDVRLGVEIQTAGEDSLKKLAAEVRALAREGDAAAPAYKAVADELDRLGQQAKELDSFQRLGKDVAQTNAAMQEAVQRAVALRTEYEKQATVTEEARASQARLRTSMGDATVAIAATRKGLLDLKAAVTEGSVSDQIAAETKAKLTRSLALQSEQQAKLKVELKDADRAVTEANKALAKLETSSTNAATAVRTLQTAFSGQLRELADTKAAFERAGQGAGAMALSQEALDAALRETVAQLGRQAAATAEMADLDAQAAAVAARLSDVVRGNAAAYERDSAALIERAAAQERSELATREAVATEARRVTALREVAEASRLAVIQETTLAAQRAKGREALDAERAALADAAAFSDKFSASLVEQAAAQERASQEALQFVLAEEKAAVAAEKAARRTAELNAQAEQTARASVYVREVAAAFDAAEKQANEAATATARLKGYFDQLAAQRDVVANAFGQTGVRSIQAIEQEMFKLQRSLIVLQTEFREGRISVADFERATSSAALRLATLKREIETIPGSKTLFQGLADGANAMITKFGALTAAVATAGLAFKPLLDAAIALDQVRRVLTTVTGSAESAAKQIIFLRQVSQQSGQAFDQIAQSYSKFAASALQSGLTLDQVQGTFKAVALAAGNLGLSTDQVKRALEALGQIASKGTVNMEELRQQLGDALPGVLPLLAKELGLTQKELIGLIESGQLLASEAIPAIGRSLKALEPTTGVVNGIIASWNRFINVVKEAGTVLADGPIGGALAGAFTALSGVIRDLSVVAVGASEAMKLLGLSTLSVLDALRGNITFSQLTEQLSDFTAQAGERLAQFKETAYGAERAAGDMGASAKGAGAEVKALGAAATVSAAEVAKANGEQAKSLAALSVANNKRIDEAIRAAAASEASAEALKKEADSAQKYGALAGEAAATTAIAADAAERYARALAAQSAADESVIATATAAKASVDAFRVANNMTEAQVKALVDELDKLILRKTGDAEKSREAAKAAEIEAAARRLAADAAKDTAGQYAELSAAVAEAGKAFVEVSKRYAQGKATLKDLEKATLNLNKAKGLLRNAYDDVNAAISRAVDTLKAENEQMVAGIKLAIARLKNEQDLAQQRGLDIQARQLGIKIAELELQVTKSNTAAKVQEAEITIRQLQLMREEVALREPANTALIAEYDNRIRRAKAMRDEALAAEENVKIEERSVEALKRGTGERDKATASSRNRAGALRDESRAADEAAKSHERLANVLNTTAGGIGGGGVQAPRGIPSIADREAGMALDENGRTADQLARLREQGGPVDASYNFQVRDRLAKGDSFTAADIPALQNALRATQENINASVRGTGGLYDTATRRDDNMWLNLLRQALEKAQGAALIGGAAGGFDITNPFGLAKPKDASSGVAVNVFVGNQRRTVNVASQSDADALIKALEEAAGT